MHQLADDEFGTRRHPYIPQFSHNFLGVFSSGTGRDNGTTSNGEEIGLATSLPARSIRP
jgi:hypothetical protein